MHLLLSILESFLGPHRKYNEDTGQAAFDCPECSMANGMPEGDGKGNLEINYDLGVFKCWVCHETNHMHGPVMKLLKKYAPAKAIRDYILVKPDADVVYSKEYKDVICTLPEGYKKLSECTDKDYKSSQAKAYLYDRGITDDIISEYNIGYTFRGPLYNRIIIPSYDSHGILNYYVSRWFPKEYNKLKYINPEIEKESIIFNEGKLNLDSTIYLVEGATDHIVIPNSIPLLGKYISDILLDLLHDKAMANIVIVLDDDAKKDAINLYNKINFGKLRDRVKICIPPDGYDVSLIYQVYGASGVIKLLKTARKLKDNEL